MTARPQPDNPQRQFSEGMGSRSLVQSDFLDPPGSKESAGIRASCGGANATVGGAATQADHPGTWAMFTGTTAIGRCFVISGAFTSWRIGAGGITRLGTWMSTGAVLSVPAQRYVQRAGMFAVVLPNTLQTGIGFEYQDDQNGGRWQALCEDGVGETSIDTGIVVAANTWYYFEWEANAAGTSVEFFIDSVSVGTIATNIPTGVTMFYNTHIMKLTGLLNTACILDAYYVYQEITR